jgi:hypothetical protein
VLEDVLGPNEILEASLTKVWQFGAVRKPVPDELLDHPGQ